MPGNYTNCYQAARKPTGLSQERAAEQLDISPESLKAYETGLRIPPNTVVVHMAEAYRTPWLALEHLKGTSEMLGVLPVGITVQTLQPAVIRLINSVLDFADQRRDRQLLRIAEDGVISEEERPAFEGILDELDGIVRAALQLKFIDEGAKKDRPDADTSKRSMFKDKSHKNDCRNIISHSAEKASLICVQRGGASL